MLLMMVERRLQGPMRNEVELLSCVGVWGTSVSGPESFEWEVGSGKWEDASKLGQLTTILWTEAKPVVC